MIMIIVRSCVFAVGMGQTVLVEDEIDGTSYARKWFWWLTILVCEILLILHEMESSFSAKCSFKFC